jgi:predicted Zn-dependent protease
VRGERDIVNPGKLAPDLRDSICAQCHLTGEVRVVRAGHDHPFQAGERFSDHEVAFVKSGGAAEMKVTSHFEKLALSACKQASGKKLWCGTCHDAHGARVDVAARCASCHQKRRCDRGEDCVSCHMPKSRVRDVEHTVYTDHSISHRLTAAKGNALVPFGGARASEREWGLAYASVAGFERRARPLLENAVRQHPEDVAVLVQLAYLYDRSSQEEKAIPLYERALRLDPSQETAAVNLASAWAKRGRADDAMRLWRDALARNAGLEVVRINIAGAQFRAGDRKGARETLVKLLELNPGNTQGRRLLAEW